jgi:hypothetical protein
MPRLAAFPSFFPILHAKSSLYIYIYIYKIKVRSLVQNFSACRLVARQRPDNQQLYLGRVSPLSMFVAADPRESCSVCLFVTLPGLTSVTASAQSIPVSGQSLEFTTAALQILSPHSPLGWIVI